EPVQQDVRRPREAAGQPDDERPRLDAERAAAPVADRFDPPCHADRENSEDEGDRDAVRGSPVGRHVEEVDVGQRCAYGTGDREFPAGAIRGRLRAERPGDRSARESMADWAGHGDQMMADSAYLVTRGERSSAL